jgi:flagellar biosynthesis/type III secretory pathway protein FliH
MTQASTTQAGTTQASTESTFIVRAARLRADDDARAIVAEAEQQALRLRADATAEIASLRLQAEAEIQAALEQARARGLDMAAAEAATLIARVAESIDRFWREREAELRDVAFAVAHRVLSALPCDDLTIRLATEAIAEHGRDTRLALKASPDTADRLRAALAKLEFADRVSVSPDPSLAPGECTLLHPEGRTEIGLVGQFRSMLFGAAGDQR